MKILSIIAGTFLFTAAQICGCGNCKVNAQTTLKALDGIVEQKVEFPGDVATVKYNPAKTSVANIIKAIEKIGYKAVAISEKATAKQS